MEQRIKTALQAAGLNLTKNYNCPANLGKTPELALAEQLKDYTNLPLEEIANDLRTIKEELEKRKQPKYVMREITDVVDALQYQVTSAYGDIKNEDVML